jgi:hypothetical protein
MARLDLRLGRVENAEAAFRSVLAIHPENVDARIGLGMALTRRGQWQDAISMLREAEHDAGRNADLFAALARAYRRAGDDGRALEYFQRAHALAPGDTDVIDGLEAVTQAYGHEVAIEGFGEGVSPGSHTTSGSAAVSIRVVPRVHMLGTARLQHGAGYADALFGGGVLWRAGRTTTVGVRAAGGPDNAALATSDVSGEVVRYLGLFEIGGGLRRLTFAGADVTAASPTIAWDEGRWRLVGRYTYSRSRFAATEESTGDHSVLLRDTWRGWRRVWITTAYAYGIESFEVLTADRISSLGASTLASGVRISTPSLTAVYATWESQWRSNATHLNRLTVSIVQAFP